MLHRTYLLSLLFFLLLSACQATDEPAPASLADRDDITLIQNAHDGTAGHGPVIDFEREQTFGADDGSEAMLAGIEALTVDDDGNLYILDSQDYVLKSFAADGSLRWTAGREGEGPGEFAGYYWRGNLAYDRNGHIYVLNQNGSRIDIFSTDGAFIESKGLDTFDLQFAGLTGITGDNRLLLSSHMFGYAGEKIHIIDLETWELLGTREIYLREDPLEDEGRAIDADFGLHQDRLLGRFHIETYEIWDAALDDPDTRVVTRAVDFMLPFGRYDFDDGGFRVQAYSSISRPLVMPDGHLLVHAYHATDVHDPQQHLRRMVEQDGPEPTFRATIDVFNPDGDYLGGRTWDGSQAPAIGTPVHIDGEGALYSVSDDPFPQVRRYAVTINTPAP